MRTTMIRWATPLAVVALLVGLGHEQTKNAQAFVAHGDSWASATADYVVNPNFTDATAGTADQQRAAIQRAASEWTSAGQIPFQFLYDGDTTTTLVAPTDAENVVFFSETDGGGALATATWASFSGGNFFGFDIEFYSFHNDGMTTTDYPWALEPESGEFDIESVAVHEFGHAIGLGHSAVPGATMFASVSAGTTGNRTLANDDILGVQSIYGTQVTGTPTISGVTPELGWIGGGERITITGTNFSGIDPQIVTIDGVAASEVTVIDQTTMSCVVPQGVTPGFVEVSMAHGQGSADGGQIFANLSNRLVGPATVGTSAMIEMLFPGNSGDGYVAAPALGFFGGIAISNFGDPSDTRVIPIDDDVLLRDQQDGLLNSVFVNFDGNLDINGRAFLSVQIPNDPGLAGLVFVVNSLALDGAALSGVDQIGTALPALIQ